MQAANVAVLSRTSKFAALPELIRSDASSWASFLSSEHPERQLPPTWTGDAPGDVDMAWRRVLVCHALRPDRLQAACALFVDQVFGSDFLASSSPELRQIVDSSPPWQHSFLLCSSAGFDTSSRVERLARDLRVSCDTLAMGSPEGYEQAEQLIASAASRPAAWVLLKNVHLAPSWLIQLEKKLHRIDPVPSFRLFLTMEFSSHIPPSLLLSSRVVVYEPPVGIRASLQRSLSSSRSERMEQEPAERSRLHLLLAWVHSVVMGRARYCPHGWSKSYEFSEVDLRSAADTIDEWVDKLAAGRSNLAPQKLPWEALRSLICTTCYGGRVDNEFDLSILHSLLSRIFDPSSYSLDFSPVPLPADSGLLKLPEGRGADAFLQWTQSLPEREEPAWLGLSADSDVLLLARDAEKTLDEWQELLNVYSGDERLVDSALVRKEEEVPRWTKTIVSMVEKWEQELPADIETKFDTKSTDAIIEPQDFLAPQARQLDPRPRPQDRPSFPAVCPAGTGRKCSAAVSVAGRTVLSRCLPDCPEAAASEKPGGKEERRGEGEERGEEMRGGGEEKRRGEERRGKEERGGGGERRGGEERGGEERSRAELAGSIE
eukprot:764095-Hanusia_phi.AAC.2